MEDAAEPPTRDAPLLSTIGTHGTYIHPPERRFKVEVRFHAEGAIYGRLKEMMGNVLWKRLTETVFGEFIHFIDRGDWKYKGRLIAFLYFNMVYPDRTDELHFKIGNERIKFGRREFAMIMGFRFGSVDVQLPSTSRCFSENCSLRKCEFNVTLTKMDAAFPTADDETKLRMGIVYFVYGIMMGTEPGKIIPRQVFYIVEDLEIVRTFPWGEYFFTNLIGSWCKIVQHFLKLGYSPQKKERPTVSGCLYAMQLWLFHAAPNIASRGEHAILREGYENALPGFMRWKCTEGGLYSNSLNGRRVEAWENIPADILTNEAERLYVISLNVPEAEVRAQPRELPAPPHVDRAHDNRPARERVERPEIDDEDMPPTQARRTSSSANPRGDHMSDNVGDDSISIVGVVRSDEISRIVQPYMEKVNDELRRARGELNELKAEFTRSKSEIVALRSELSGVKAQASTTSIELSEVKAQLSEAMSEIRAVSSANHRLEARLKKLERREDHHDDDQYESEIGRSENNPTGGFQSGTSVGALVVGEFDTPRGNETDAGHNQATQSMSTAQVMPETRIRTPTLTQLESASFEGLSTPGAECDISAIGFPSRSGGQEVRTSVQTVLFEEAGPTASIARVPKKRGGGRWKETGRVRGGRGRGNAIGRGVHIPGRLVRSVVKRPNFLRGDSSWISETTRMGQNRLVVTRRIPDDEIKPLRNWLDSKGGDDSVPLVNGCLVEGVCFDLPAGREFFRLLMCDLQIEAAHIDAYVGLLRARMKEYPDNYQKHAILCYSSFASTLVNELKSWNGDMTVEAPGVLSLETSAWDKKTVAYSVWMVNTVNWLLVVMDIERWTLSVYDSRSGIGDELLVDDVIGKWCKYMRILLRTSPSAKSHQMMLDTGERPFDRINETCPQTLKWRYCGLYALKIVELLIIPEADIYCVDDNNIHTIRKKMAVDLYWRNLAY